MSRRNAGETTGQEGAGRWWTGLALAAVTTLFLMEAPGRLMYCWLRSHRHAADLLAGVHDSALKAKLRHDFVDAKTKIKYDYDMFLGWRAHPSQHGLTYNINAEGHRGGEEDDLLGDDVVLLTGGSAAWSYGASDDEHTLAACLERRLNVIAGSGRMIRVLNLAEQAYGMRQEEMVVIDGITQYRPRAVVFYDGVNDTHSVFLGKDPDHFRTYAEFPRIVEDALREAEGPVLVLRPADVLSWSMTWKTVSRLWNALAPDRDATRDSTMIAAQAGVIRSFFRERLRHLGEIMSRLAVPAVFVLQPIGYVARRPVSGEEFLTNDPWATWWKGAYGVVQETYAAIGEEGDAETVDLTGVFAEEPEQVYIDPWHMTDRGNEVVAAVLAPVIVKALGR